MNTGIIDHLPDNLGDYRGEFADNPGKAGEPDPSVKTGTDGCFNRHPQAEGDNEDHNWDHHGSTKGIKKVINKFEQEKHAPFFRLSPL